MISPEVAEDDVDMNQSSSEPPPPPRRSKSNNRKKAGKGGSSRGIRQGDLVSADATVFDDPEEPGSWSDENPARCFGVVSSITADGKVTVRWNEDGNELDIKLKDLRKEVAKATDARILVFLIEGSTIAYESQDKSRWPKDFFQLLVKKDWRKWVEAAKKELSGWEENQAMKVVDVKDVLFRSKQIFTGASFICVIMLFPLKILTLSCHLPPVAKVLTASKSAAVALTVFDSITIKGPALVTFATVCSGCMSVCILLYSS